MKIRIVFISFLFFCIASVLKGQEITINVNHLEIISLDSLTFKKYNWAKCVVNMSDTIIVLSEKNLASNCIQMPVIKLKKISYINDDIGCRFYSNDIYIDGILYFPKETEVYLLNCLND